MKYPDCGGELIYSTGPKGDGRFNYDERSFYLNAAKEAIIKKIKKTCWEL